MQFYISTYICFCYCLYVSFRFARSNIPSFFLSLFTIRIDSDSDEGEWEEVNGEEIEDDSDEGEWVTMEDDESEEGEEEEEEEVKVVKKQAQKLPKKKAVAAPTPTPANGTEKTASADRIDQVRVRIFYYYLSFFL